MKILILPPLGLGDYVFIIPFLNSLKHYYPNADIYIKTNDDKSKQELIEIMGLKIYPVLYPSPDDELRKEFAQVLDANVNDQWKIRHEYEKRIHERDIKENIDLLISFRPYYLDIPNIKKQYSFLDIKKKDGHIIDIFLSYCDLLGIEKIKPKSSKLNNTDSYIILSLSVYFNKKFTPSHRDKRWNLKSWFRVAQWLNKQGYNIILVGDKTEYIWSRIIESAFTNVNNLINKEGYSTDIPTFISLCKNAKLLVGLDTGLTHLADAVGCKVLSLFPRSSTPIKFVPYHNRDTILYKNSMDEITAEEVINEIKKMTA